MMEGQVKQFIIAGTQVIQTQMHHPVQTDIIMHIFILHQILQII